MLTNAELDRMVEAFLVKAKNVGDPSCYPSHDDWLRVVIGTAIVDAELISEGVLRIEQFE